MVAVFVWSILFPLSWPRAATKSYGSRGFFQVGQSGRRDRFLWSSEAGEGLLGLHKFLLYLSSNPSVSFPKTFWEKPFGERVAPSLKVTWEQTSFLSASVANSLALRFCLVPEGGFEHQLSGAISGLITYFNVPCTGSLLDVVLWAISPQSASLPLFNLWPVKTRVNQEF